MATIASTPDPLPHGATGTVEWSEPQGRNVWASVALKLPDGDLTAISSLALFRGETTFTFGPTPTWDGTGGGSILLELFHFSGGRRRSLATGKGTYEA